MVGGEESIRDNAADDDDDDEDDKDCLYGDIVELAVEEGEEGIDAPSLFLLGLGAKNDETLEFVGKVVFGFFFLGCNDDDDDDNDDDGGGGNEDDDDDASWDCGTASVCSCCCW